jgi:ABC-type nitrate/sulfonate/bicarbonate transport system permease component
MVETTNSHRAARPARARRAVVSRLRYGAISVVSAVGFIGLWEALAAGGVIDAEFFPPPTRVSGELLKLLNDGTLITFALISARRVLTGFAFSAVFGIALASCSARRVHCVGWCNR